MTNTLMSKQGNHKECRVPGVMSAGRYDVTARGVTVGYHTTPPSLHLTE